MRPSRTCSLPYSHGRLRDVHPEYPCDSILAQLPGPLTTLSTIALQQNFRTRSSPNYDYRPAASEAESLCKGCGNGSASPTPLAQRLRQIQSRPGRVGCHWWVGVRTGRDGICTPREGFVTARERAPYCIMEFADVPRMGLWLKRLIRNSLFGPAGGRSNQPGFVC